MGHNGVRDVLLSAIKDTIDRLDTLLLKIDHVELNKIRADLWSVWVGAVSESRQGQGKLRNWFELISPMRAIYARHSAGCCWHVVLDDGNVDRGSVEFCAKEAEQRECRMCLVLVPLIRRASLTQISKARMQLFRHYEQDVRGFYNGVK